MTYDTNIKQLTHMLEETQRQLNNALSEVSQLRKSIASGMGGLPAESAQTHTHTIFLYSLSSNFPSAFNLFLFTFA